jgi:serine/threonine-protein kinase RsbW
MSDDQSGVVRLTFPAKAEYLLLARLALVGLARTMPFDTETVADLKLAVTEACGNVVRHAYAGSEGNVLVTFDVAPSRFEMVVEDDGSGLAAVVEELDLVDAVQAGRALEPATQGMGMAIIRAVVDELDVGDRADGAGTRVRMTKLLSAAEAASS